MDVDCHRNAVCVRTRVIGTRAQQDSNPVPTIRLENAAWIAQLKGLLRADACAFSHSIRGGETWNSLFFTEIDGGGPRGGVGVARGIIARALAELERKGLAHGRQRAQRNGELLAVHVGCTKAEAPPQPKRQSTTVSRNERCAHNGREAADGKQQQQRQRAKECQWEREKRAQVACSLMVAQVIAQSAASPVLSLQSIPAYRHDWSSIGLENIRRKPNQVAVGLLVPAE